MPNSETYQKNTKEQYEMLGRFIEAFELMVYEVRQVILTAAARDAKNYPLFETILYHNTLTAKPLFDIMRAVIAEILKDTLQQQEDRKNGIVDADGPLWIDGFGKPVPLTILERDTFFGVIGFINGKFNELANRRNDLLHGTWFVGFSSKDDPDSAEFYIRRARTSGTGLSFVLDLPKNATELNDLAGRCTDIRDWLSRIEDCFQCNRKVTDTFRSEDSTWWMTDPPGTRRTLQ
jgi:hypothetical protein